MNLDRSLISEYFKGNQIDSFEKLGYIDSYYVKSGGSGMPVVHVSGISEIPTADSKFVVLTNSADLLRSVDIFLKEEDVKYGLRYTSRSIMDETIRVQGLGEQGASVGEKIPFKVFNVSVKLPLEWIGVEKSF